MSPFNMFLMCVTASMMNNTRALTERHTESIVALPFRGDACVGPLQLQLGLILPAGGRAGSAPAVESVICDAHEVGMKRTVHNERMMHLRSG